jgi:quercetin dioxygenase-like cupin family protein
LFAFILADVIILHLIKYGGKMKDNQKKGYYQQGDVLMKIMDEQPIDKEAEMLEHMTLAEGEATGHYHRVTEGKAELYMLTGQMYMKVLTDKAKITHEEHNPIEVPKGLYKIDIVKEYDHFAEEVREVVD